jgi:RNA polymerase sigma-70 factor (ECF subfamily)
MSEDSDEKLISNYLGGDQKSLEVLIQRYLKPIYNFIYQYFRNLDETEDITQEVFVKMWRNLKKFNPKKSYFAKIKNEQGKSFRTWIFSIAKNTAIDALRKRKSIPFSEFENEDGKNILIEKLKDPAPLPNKLFEKADTARIVNSAIEKLSPKYRTVLLLKYNDHFTFREIAESLGESPNTIRSRHRRALAYLNKMLANY